ncbi:MAG: hypothetical protein V2J65_00085 [Desulfobacteraceae bacterium]|jgi:hypothetical protein|nr:hypothetical protein [Desulfobacteraceae bacterium]
MDQNKVSEPYHRHRRFDFPGSATADILKLFSEIDGVINGEGELPFSQLVSGLFLIIREKASKLEQ